MATRFVPVVDEGGLEALLERSRGGPVLLFNADPG